MDIPPHHELEQLRRSIAMLPPGHDAMDRERALELLARLQQVSARVNRLEVGLRELLAEPERGGHGVGR